MTLESFGPDPDRRGWVMGTVTVALAKGVSGDGVTGVLETADGAA